MSWVKPAAGAVIAATLAFAPAAYPDDTEIYLGGNLGKTEVKPNIVFIIDTSGSMTSTVSTQVPFDPNTTYSGSCRTDRVYWSTTGSPPSCSTSNWISTTNNKCKASLAPLDSTGYYSGSRMAMWDSSGKKWITFSSSVRGNVECQADWGIHGETDGNSRVYPANSNNGPWSTSTNSAIKWSNTGSGYTIYSGNYLNYRHNHSTITKTRLEIVQEVFGNLMDSTDGVNVAVVRFDARTTSSNDGGYFVTGMLPLEDTPLPELGGKTSRQHLKDVVNAFEARGNTPLAETLYEVARFYRGEAPKFGLNTTPGHSVPDCMKNGKYVSPIDYQCQKNFIVLLTDGEPTYDTSADNDIPKLPGFAAATGVSKCSSNCLDELAQYLYKVDQRPDLNDNQNVITYTVGFHTDQKLLSDTAKKGGGKYYTTTDTAGLTDAFTNILTEIRAVNDIFTAPAVSVNAFNRLTHRDELYFAVFRPSEYPRWDGNIKRYRLGGNPLMVRDVNGDPAVDPNTGFFKADSTSFWTPASDAPDGDVVHAGGAASQMPVSRTVFTDDGAASPELISFNTTNITTALLDVSTTTERDRIVSWVNGVDVLDEDLDGSFVDARTRMGDPLHTEPILVTYGGTDASPDITLFASTNAGFLHAINVSTGKEQFSYIPRDLVGNLRTLFDDPPSEAHPYGLDGPLTAWVKDNNGNGIIEVADGDKVYLYASMRRGGRNIYALDVTNRSEPKLQWIIRGGTGNFAELGQTWSQPVLARVKFNNTERTVLIIGGGYDIAQDANEMVQSDNVGRAIYVVDALTGERLWWASHGSSNANLKLEKMNNSIPSTVRVIDVNGDGYADRFYVGDMAARLWRFDVNPGNTGAGNFATGGVIAELGGATAANNRRFFYPPDVSMAPKNAFLNIAIGSGYRAHPLDKTIHDYFFIIRDFNVFEAPKGETGNVSYTAVGLNDLYDATDNVLGEGTVAYSPTEAEREAAKKTLEDRYGLYIKLNRKDGTWEGEKVLAESVTQAGNVIFTTFTPVAGESAACAPSQGTAKTYIMSVLDATPVLEHDGLEGLTREDRHVLLVRGGIPPRPTPVCTEGGCTVLVGPEMPLPPGLQSRNPIKAQWWRN